MTALRYFLLSLRLPWDDNILQISESAMERVGFFFASREKIETKVVAIEKLFDDSESESGKQLEKLHQLFEELCKVVRDAGLDECGYMVAFIDKLAPLFEKAMRKLATDKLLNPDSLERQLLSSICQFTAQFTFMKELPLVEEGFKIKSIVHNIDSVEKFDKNETLDMAKAAARHKILVRTRFPDPDAPLQKMLQEKFANKYEALNDTKAVLDIYGFINNEIASKVTALEEMITKTKGLVAMEMNKQRVDELEVAHWPIAQDFF